MSQDLEQKRGVFTEAENELKAVNQRTAKDRRVAADLEKAITKLTRQGEKLVRHAHTPYCGSRSSVDCVAGLVFVCWFVGCVCVCACSDRRSFK